MSCNSFNEFNLVFYIKMLIDLESLLKFIYRCAKAISLA